VLLDRAQWHLLADVDEIFDRASFQIGLVSQEDFSFFKIAHDVDEAVREILQFYKVYHFCALVEEKLVLRICQPLSKDAVAELNKNSRT